MSVPHTPYPHILCQYRTPHNTCLDDHSSLPDSTRTSYSHSLCQYRTPHSTCVHPEIKNRKPRTIGRSYLRLGPIAGRRLELRLGS
eukprot:1744743-Rhodomonas_salina.2